MVQLNKPLKITIHLIVDEMVMVVEMQKWIACLTMWSLSIKNTACNLIYALSSSDNEDQLVTVYHLSHVGSLSLEHAKLLL